MKTIRERSIAVVSAAMLVWACGGRVSEGNGDSGATGDDAGTVDSGSDGGCDGFGCLDASTTCPAMPPDTGSFCPTDGAVCAFTTSCGPEFVCRNNAWTMVIRTCPPHPTCAATPPSGTCNGEVGLSCSWGSGCNAETCDCVATPGGAIWRCSGTICVDAGHTGDSGH